MDNGSTDGTAAVARAMSALVACEPARGYGRACLKGFKTAVALGAEIVIFMDGDGSDDPADPAAQMAVPGDAGARGQRDELRRAVQRDDEPAP